MAHREDSLTGAGVTVGSSLAAAAKQREILVQARPSPGYWRRAWRRYRQNSIAVVALVMAGLIVVFGLSAPLISHYVTGYSYAENHLRDKLKPPGTDGYILGTDGNGRDVLTRLAYGGRVSLLFAALGALSLLVIGGTIGSVAGFFGGVIDTVLMRMCDAMAAIPALPLLVLVSSFYHPTWQLLAVVIAVFSWSDIARLVRGEVLSLKRRDYVEAARILGASNGRIIWRHLTPNVIPIIVAWASLVVPALILTEASLSYLGLGVRVPTPSWGNMLQDAKQFVRTSWTLVFIPGFMIYITVLSVNLVGTGLRDALDPRLNQ
jgi:peptide/nickel transport system permease protein